VLPLCRIYTVCSDQVRLDVFLLLFCIHDNHVNKIQCFHVYIVTLMGGVTTIRLPFFSITVKSVKCLEMNVGLSLVTMETNSL